MQVELARPAAVVMPRLETRAMRLARQSFQFQMIVDRVAPLLTMACTLSADKAARDELSGIQTTMGMVLHLLSSQFV